MPLSNFEKNKIRNALTLELNSCFSNVSRHYEKNGSEEDREFLQTLIESIKECVNVKNEPAKESE